MRPSRASFFTGQYVHNHGVRKNLKPEGGFTLFQQHESSTIATWLQDAGYRTSLMGKYINGYPTGRPAEYVPPGWDDWYGHLAAFEDDKYYNYFINDNGQVVWHAAEPEDYSTDDLARRSVEFIHDSVDHPEPSRPPTRRRPTATVTGASSAPRPHPACPRSTSPTSATSPGVSAGPT